MEMHLKGLLIRSIYQVAIEKMGRARARLRHHLARGTVRARLGDIISVGLGQYHFPILYPVK